MTTHGKEGFVSSAICRFIGCDDAASRTIGTVRLCALHQSYILQLMDSGAIADRSSDVGSPITSGGWSLISVGDLEL